MSIEYVKTKKRFVELVNKMEQPILYYGMADRLNVNRWFLVKDDANYRNSFNLPGCYASENGSLSQYNKREVKLTIKYENWMYFVCGKHCRSIFT